MVPDLKSRLMSFVLNTLGTKTPGWRHFSFSNRFIRLWRPGIPGAIRNAVPERTAFLNWFEVRLDLVALVALGTLPVDEITKRGAARRR